MELAKKEIQNLIRIAADARKSAYAPYSQFTVGAALLGQMRRYTPDVILRMQHLHRETVQSGQLCLRL